MTYKVDPNLRYLPEHDWAKIEGDFVLVGVTDFAQKSLKDVVYVELPEIGTVFNFREVFGSIESVKAASELFCPVGGEIIETNVAINNAPEKVNEDPYGAWLIKIKPSTLETDWNKLMTPEEYSKYCAEEEEED
jgi:glycine cleavage system H protein